MKWLIVMLLVLMALPLAYASDFNGEISDDDKETFDKILEPVIKIYNLVKYAATAIAVLVLLFAGVLFMMGGNDPKHRDTAKSMATYVVVGLIVIWAAPLVVNFVVS